jgi:hypothetical protein
MVSGSTMAEGAVDRRRRTVAVAFVATKGGSRARAAARDACEKCFGDLQFFQDLLAFSAAAGGDLPYRVHVVTVPLLEMRSPWCESLCELLFTVSPFTYLR